MKNGLSFGRSTDHSIFAWSAPDHDSVLYQGKLLAPNARCFAKARDIEAGAEVVFGDSYDISNSGLRISLPVKESGNQLIAQLNCQVAGISVKLRLKRHTQQQNGAAKQYARRIVCEVERNSPEKENHEEEEPLRSPIDSDITKHLVILKESFSCGINVSFDMSQGVQITTASPALQGNDVYLSASTPGDFSQGYVVVQMNNPPLQERLHFGHFCIYLLQNQLSVFTGSEALIMHRLMTCLTCKKIS